MKHAALVLSAQIFVACASQPPANPPTAQASPSEPVYYADDSAGPTEDSSAATALGAASALQATRPQLFRPAKTDDPSVQKNSDGTLNVSLQDKSGDALVIVTEGDAQRQADIALALQRFSARDNQLALYAAILEDLTDTQRQGLRSSDAVAQLSDAEVHAALKSLASEWANLLAGAAKSPSKPHTPVDCSTEEGAGAGTDRTGKLCGAATGIMAVHSWPFKDDLTCVKNQGHRGTCVGFAATSAIEMQIMKKYNRRVNLSEQALYAEMKLVIDHTNFGDGLKTTMTLPSLISQSYLVPFETQWDYNPSPHRITDDSSDTYADSCVDYTGQACSNTVHQANKVTKNGSIGYQMPANQSLSGFRPKTVVSTWDPSDPETSLGLAILSLMAGHSLEVGLQVTQSFKDASKGDGFVKYQGSNEDHLGGHGVHVVGYIANADLAVEGPSMPAGAGGGYLIIKNSWGRCAGDDGFFYVPFSWAKDYISAGMSLTAVY